ncbi:MAG TPA: hypothetical protein V6D08_13080 [Candidatus Obscuribacterales bacterium]
MNVFSKLTMAAIGTSFAVAMFLGAPAHAQFGGDAFSAGAPGEQQRFNPITGSQTDTVDTGRAPMLQGATNGTIGPQAGDATVVQGINTAGTVRVNNLANLEALLNIIANGLEILGIAWGGPTMIFGFMHMAAGTQDAMKKVLFGAAGVTGGLATPGVINWLVASARDANLFS